MSGSALGPTENSAEVHLSRKRKKKWKRKTKINVEVQREVHTGSTENLAEGSVIIEKPNNREDVQNIGQTNMYTGSTENLAEGNLMIIKNPKIQDDVQSPDQNEMDTSPKRSSAEGIVIGKRKKKPKGRVKVKDETQSNIGPRSTENLAQGNAVNEIPKIKDEVQSTGMAKIDAGSKGNLAEGNVSIKNLKIEDEVQNTDQTKMNMEPVENFAKGNLTGKRKKKSNWKKKKENLVVGNVITKKPKINDEVQSTGLTTMDTESTEKSTEGNEVHSKDQTEMDTGPIQNSAEGNVTKNRKRKRKQNRTKKAKLKDEASRKIDGGSVENLPEGNAFIKLSGDCISNCEALAGPMEFEGKLCPCESQEICHPHLMVGQKEKPENGLSELCNEIILDNGKGYAEGASSISSSNVRVTMDNSSCNVKNAKDICPSPIIPVRKKLLVLDVNGLLADIVISAPNHCRWDIKICRRAVFKRPFCDDFLKFCFQNFDVGIWSSRSKKIIKPVVKYLLGGQKDKLLFCWDMGHATKTRFKTLENKHKPLVCKELSKIWESDDCNLRWKKGDYDESNTLLLDDSPYKALLNPLHTAIFPSTYQHDNENDDSLGPGGNLRVYLEGLVTAENVQKYVEQHPFGQRPITEEHCSWEFYSRVIHQVSNAVEGKTSMPKGRDVKRVKARQASPFKPKKEKAMTTFLWPI